MLKSDIQDRLRPLLLVMAGMVALDQLTKYLIVSYLSPFDSIPILGNAVRLTFVLNQNGAFSLAPQRLLPFLTPLQFYGFFNLLAASLVFILYWKTPLSERFTRLAFMLILSGAIGNLIDRFRLGKVVDFIDCDFPNIVMERWPVFNVADSCVTVGITILILVTIFSKKNEHPAPPSNG